MRGTAWPNSWENHSVILRGSSGNSDEEVKQFQQEMWRKSIPSSTIFFAWVMVSWIRTPTWWYSGERRTPTMKFSGVLDLTFRIISSRKLVRDLQSPPHLSFLRLVCSPRNWQIRYPWAPCNSMPSNPAIAQRAAASPKASMRWSISSPVASRDLPE